MMSINILFNIYFQTDWKLRIIPIIIFIVICFINLFFQRNYKTTQTSGLILISNAYISITMSLLLIDFRFFNSVIFYTIPLITVNFFFVFGRLRDVFTALILILLFTYSFKDLFFGHTTTVQYSFMSVIDFCNAIFLTTVFNYLFIKNQNDMRNGQELIFSVLFHDLATPLNNLFLLTYDYKKFSEGDFLLSRQIVFNLKNYIESVKGFQKNTYGKLALKTSEVKIEKLILSIVDIFKYQSIDNRYELNILPYNKEIKVNVNVDVFLNSICGNIISNIFKHSKNSAQIVLEVRKSDDITLFNFIDNNGDELPQNIIDSVNRNDIKNVNDVVSSGFGLPIVKALMLTFHGDFKISHVQGKNIFTLVFKDYK